jgi:glycosyltransferase involved in cell wall biosynthesis
MKGKNPLFTIITVCYNSERTIARTIQSVLNQTINDYEYWIIDGGSKDSTTQIIESYKSLFKDNLFYISEPDTGIYNAMNKGIKSANGKVIGIVNSDDWLESDALEALSSFIEKVSEPYYSIYCGWMNFHYENGDISILKTSRERLNRCYEKCDMGVRHPATFISGYIYEQVGLFDESFKIMADQDFIFRCIQSQIPFYFIDKSLTNMSDGGVSNDKRYKKMVMSDFKSFYSKYTHSKTEYYKRLYRNILVVNLKMFIPRKMLRVFRAFTN